MSGHLKTNIERAEHWLARAVEEASDGNASMAAACAQISQAYSALPNIITEEDTRESDCPYAHNHAMFAAQDRKCPLCGAVA